MSFVSYSIFFLTSEISLIISFIHKLWLFGFNDNSFISIAKSFLFSAADVVIFNGEFNLVINAEAGLIPLLLKLFTGNILFLLLYILSSNSDSDSEPLFNIKFI